MTENQKAAEIRNILSEWNPAAASWSTAGQSVDYEVEAEDILWTIRTRGYSLKKSVSIVVQEAFNVEIDQAELDHYTNEIEKALAKR